MNLDKDSNEKVKKNHTKSKIEQETKEMRLININGVQKKKYMSNYIKTAKYNIFTFLPLSIFYQFNNYFNCFFLFTAVLTSISLISPLDPATAIGPFIFVLSISLIREAIENIKKVNYDKVANNSDASMFDIDNRCFLDKKWADLLVGKIIKIKKNEMIPADILIIKSSDENGLCYLETTNLDGESALKPRQSVISYQKKIFHESDLSNITDIIEVDLPNNHIYKVEGYIYFIKEKNRKEFFSIDNILLRGGRLKNTEFVWGIVVYTGKDTKIMKNIKEGVPKQSTIEMKLNTIIIYVLLIVIFLCVICTIFGAYFRANLIPDYKNGLPRGEYIFYYDPDTQTSSSGEILEIIRIFAGLFIIFNTLIPISLMISSEVIKTFQVGIIESDQEMKLDPDDKLKILSMKLHEDLGSVRYIFSDKTGTLTKNEMSFRACSIFAKSFGETDEDQEKILDDKVQQIVSNTNLNQFNSKSSNNIKSSVVRKSIFSNNFNKDSLINAIQEGGIMNIRDIKESPIQTMGEACKEFLFNISLNHNVLVDLDDGHQEKDQVMSTNIRKSSQIIKGESNKNIPNVTEDHKKNNIQEHLKYQGSNPDEVVLVTAASEIGIKFLNKDKEYLIINYFENTKKFKILQKFEFSSERKRSSIIIEDEEGNIKIYVKGSDEKILYNNNINDFSKKFLLKDTKEHLDTFARVGLRTLCFAYKYIQKEEYNKWEEEFNRLKMDCIIDKSKYSELELFISKMEENLILLGVTALEDKLQDNVKSDLQEFIEAGISVWMITGDKLDTAESIGHSCRLFNDDTEVFKIKSSEKRITKETLKDIKNKFDLMKGVSEDLNKLRKEIQEKNGESVTKSGSKKEKKIQINNLMETLHLNNHNQQSNYYDNPFKMEEKTKRDSDEKRENQFNNTILQNSENNNVFSNQDLNKYITSNMTSNKINELKVDQHIEEQEKNEKNNSKNYDNNNMSIREETNKFIGGFKYESENQSPFKKLNFNEDETDNYKVNILQRTISDPTKPNNPDNEINIHLPVNHATDLTSTVKILNQDSNPFIHEDIEKIRNKTSSILKNETENNKEDSSRVNLLNEKYSRTFLPTLKSRDFSFRHSKSNAEELYINKNDVKKKNENDFSDTEDKNKIIKNLIQMNSKRKIDIIENKTHGFFPQYRGGEINIKIMSNKELEKVGQRLNLSKMNLTDDLDKDVEINNELNHHIVNEENHKTFNSYLSSDEGDEFYDGKRVQVTKDLKDKNFNNNLTSFYPRERKNLKDMLSKNLNSSSKNLQRRKSLTPNISMMDRNNILNGIGLKLFENEETPLPNDTDKEIDLSDSAIIEYLANNHYLDDSQGQIYNPTFFDNFINKNLNDTNNKILQNSEKRDMIINSNSRNRLNPKISINDLKLLIKQNMSNQAYKDFVNSNNKIDNNLSNNLVKSNKNSNINSLDMSNNKNNNRDKKNEDFHDKSNNIENSQVKDEVDKRIINRERNYFYSVKEKKKYDINNYQKQKEMDHKNEKEDKDIKNSDEKRFLSNGSNKINKESDKENMNLRRDKDPKLFKTLQFNNIGEKAKKMDINKIIEELQTKVDGQKPKNVFNKLIDFKKTNDENIENLQFKVMNLGVVIEGDSISHCLDDDLKELFWSIVRNSKSVVCCRCSPTQKAEVVNFVKKKSGEVTLAIGDGGNDIPMIKIANVGVGIFGKEGYQAAFNSDYAISQFKYLKRLIFIHGRNSLVRNSYFIYFFFFKNVLFTLTQLWFCFFSGFSGQSFYDSWYYLGFNSFLTSLPIAARTIVEEDIDLNIVYTNQKDRKINLIPDIYFEYRESLPFHILKFFFVFVTALIYSMVTYFIPYYIFQFNFQNQLGRQFTLYDHGLSSYLSIIIIHFFFLFEDTYFYNWFVIVCYIGQIIVLFIFIFVHDSMNSGELSGITNDILSNFNFWAVTILNSAISCGLFYILRRFDFLFSDSMINSIMQNKFESNFTHKLYKKKLEEIRKLHRSIAKFKKFFKMKNEEPDNLSDKRFKDIVDAYKRNHINTDKKSIDHNTKEMNMIKKSKSERFDDIEAQERRIKHSKINKDDHHRVKFETNQNVETHDREKQTNIKLFDFNPHPSKFGG